MKLDNIDLDNIPEYIIQDKENYRISSKPYKLKKIPNTFIEFISIIDDYFMTEEFIDFRYNYIKSLTSKQNIGRINSIKLSTINKLFDKIYSLIVGNNNDYQFQTINSKEIQKALSINSSVYRFTIQLFIELNILEVTGYSVKNFTSRKYKLINRAFNEIDLFPITFDTEVFHYIKRELNKTKSKKSRHLSNLKKDKYRLKVINKYRSNVKNLESKLKDDEIIDRSIKYFVNRTSRLRQFKDTIYKVNLDNGITFDKFNITLSKDDRSWNWTTSLFKQMREYILINGQSTISKDITAANPTFLSNHLMTLANYKDLPDVKLFYKICTEQDIYQYTADQLIISRSDAKLLWQSINGTRYINYVENPFVINKKLEPLNRIFPSIVLFTDLLKCKNPFIKSFNKRKELGYNRVISDFLNGLVARHVNRISDILNDSGIINITTYDEIRFDYQFVDKFNLIIKKYQIDNNINFQYK